MFCPKAVNYGRHREKLEQQKSYFENQAKKCGRISKHSLDSDNKQAYAKRAEAWQDKADETAEKLDATVAKSEKSVIMKSRDVARLEQAKKRDHKIEITDIAIDKISRSTVSEFSDIQNKLVDEVHKELLTKCAKKDYRFGEPISMEEI